jgi:hypothetical protein
MPDPIKAILARAIEISLNTEAARGADKTGAS